MALSTRLTATAAGAALGLGLLAGCAAAAAQPVPPAPSIPAASAAPTASAPSRARVGRPAASTRVRFVPTAIELPGGARSTVEPASTTVDGELTVPEDVDHVGWWDGGAWAGDPFGTTVIAGHIDSATDGLGFFARLLQVRPGGVVTVVDRDGHRQRYRVTSTRTVAKQALATSSSTFDQTGAHRLVLITCTGQYRADRGGYDSNLVVTAEPVGLAR